MRARRTGVIGVLLADFEPFSAEILKGVGAAVHDTAFDLLAYSGSRHGQGEGWERRSLSRLSGTLIDAAIMVTPTVVGASTEIPVVAIDPHTRPRRPADRRVGQLRRRADGDPAPARPRPPPHQLPGRAPRSAIRGPARCWVSTRAERRRHPGRSRSDPHRSLRARGHEGFGADPAGRAVPAHGRVRRERPLGHRRDRVAHELGLGCRKTSRWWGSTTCRRPPAAPCLSPRSSSRLRRLGFGGGRDGLRPPRRAARRGDARHATTRLVVRATTAAIGNE